MQESLVLKHILKNNTSIFECPEPFAKWYCLNGANCFSVKIHDSTIYNCWCPKGFHGLRCDYKYVTTTRQYPLEVDTGGNESKVSESKIDRDDQVSFTLTVSQHDSSPKSDSMGSMARRYAKGIHFIVLEALIIILVLTLVMLITRYLKRKLSDQVTMGLSEAIAVAASDNRQHQTRTENELINHDRSCESIRLDMINREPQESGQKQALNAQIHGKLYHNQQHHCQNHQTSANIKHNCCTTTRSSLSELHHQMNETLPISLVKFDHQQSQF